MKRVIQPKQMEHLCKVYDASKKEERDCNNQTQKKMPKRRRNSSPLSYIEVISYAILSSPQKRVTLAEIYSFIQNTYPSFTENRVRWKNTVRHNLSLHECFQRGEIAMDKAGCYWHIHPSFLAEFSRGDFSRRKLSQNPPLTSEGTSSLVENQLTFQSPIFPCYMCDSTPPFSVPPIGSLPYHRRGIPVSFQHPYFSRDHWIFN